MIDKKRLREIEDMLSFCPSNVQEALIELMDEVNSLEQKLLEFGPLIVELEKYRNSLPQPASPDEQVEERITAAEKNLMLLWEAMYPHGLTVQGLFEPDGSKYHDHS